MRHAVRAEHHVHFRRIVERRQRLVDRFHQRVDVAGIFVKLGHRVHPRIPSVRLEAPFPFVQAAAGGGAGILRIERQQHDLLRRVRLQLANGFRGERMPIAHGHHHARIEIAPQLGLQRPRLPLGKLQDRRAAPDLRIMMPHVPRARRGNQARQRLPRNARERKIDDVRIARTDCRETARWLRANPARPVEKERPLFWTSIPIRLSVLHSGSRLEAAAGRGLPHDYTKEMPCLPPDAARRHRAVPLRPSRPAITHRPSRRASSSST